jgi:hypothetical protein
MSQESPKPHPFDAKDGPNVINHGGTRVAIRPPSGSSPTQVKVELQKIERQLYHLFDRVKQLGQKIA